MSNTENANNKNSEQPVTRSTTQRSDVNPQHENDQQPQTRNMVQRDDRNPIGRRTNYNRDMNHPRNHENRGFYNGSRSRYNDSRDNYPRNYNYERDRDYVPERNYVSSRRGFFPQRRRDDGYYKRINYPVAREEEFHRERRGSYEHLLPVRRIANYPSRYNDRRHTYEPRRMSVYGNFRREMMTNGVANQEQRREMNKRIHKEDEIIPSKEKLDADIVRYMNGEKML